MFTLSMSASRFTETLLGCLRGKTHLKVFRLRDGVAPSSGTCCCKYWLRSPYLMYSTMTHGGSSSVHVPRTRTMFGSLRRAMILTSLWKSTLKYTEAAIRKNIIHKVALIIKALYQVFTHIMIYFLHNLSKDMNVFKRSHPHFEARLFFIC